MALYCGLAELVGTSNAEQLTALSGTEEFEIVCLRNPNNLTEQAKDALFRQTIPYTSRAFGEDMDTMTEESRFQHLSHTLGGEGSP